MAGAAPEIAPISSTPGPDGQTVQTFQQWDPQQWFDQSRWSLTGTQADSNFKSGLWWSDAKDMKAAVPSLLKHADSWVTGRGQLLDAQQKARTAKAQIAGYSGASAKANSDALDHLDKALQARMDSVEPVPDALRNAAQVINQNYPTMQALWAKWENDRANAPVCHEDTVQMQQPISNMAQAFLNASNVMMKAYQTELAPPSVTSDPPSSDSQIGPSQDDGTVAGTTPTTVTNTAAPTTVAGISNAGSVPGTLVTPTASAGHIAGLAGVGSSAVAPAIHPATLGHAAMVTGGAHAGTAVPPTAVPVTAVPVTAVPGTIGGAHVAAAAHATTAGHTAASAPTLAGAGSGTLAPPTPASAGGSLGLAGGAPGGAFAPAGPAPVSGGVVSGGAVGGSGMGFMPLAGGAPAGGAGTRRQRDDERSGAAMPLTPPLSGGTGRPGATIRPGVARRTGSAEAAGTVGGLRGRTGEATAGPGALKRRSTRSRRDHDGDRVQFLDEEVWETDDAGSGVVGAKDTDGLT